MPRLKWDEIGKKKFEAGSKNLVLFLLGDDGTYEAGVAWSGTTAVTVSNTGGDETALWADDIKYASLRAAEECGGTLESYWEIPEFYECDGAAEPVPGVMIGQQNRRPFALAFVTTIGNDAKGLDYGYKIHLVYNATASPSERAYTTINDSPDGMNLSWEFKCTPVPCTGHKPVAHLEIDSTTVNEDKLTAFKDILWGTDAAGSGTGSDSRLPLPDEVLTHFAP